MKTITYDENNSRGANVENALKQVFESYFGEQIAVKPGALPKGGIDDNMAVLTMEDGLTVSICTQGRHLAEVNCYGGWTTNRKYFRLEDPNHVEDLLPTFDLYWVADPDPVTRKPWWTLRGAYLINFKKAYQLVQQGKLKLDIPNRRFGEIQLKDLRNANCIVAEFHI